MRAIVLASTSPYRRALLDRLGIPYVALAPDYDERAAGAGIDDPEALVRAHARGKAESVAPHAPDALVIGSDQVAVLDGATLGKPGTPARAVEQLRAMRGREHELLTAVTVLDAASGRAEAHVERTTLALRDLTAGEIDAYVARERPLDCAGSYRVEALGISLLAYQRGDDPTAVIGLPLIATCRLLRAHGVNVLEVAGGTAEGGDRG